MEKNAFGVGGETGELRRGLLWGDLRERPLGYLGLYRRIILKRIFTEWDREACSGMTWLKIGRGGGRL
jgi:hypothetical protein